MKQIEIVINISKIENYQYFGIAINQSLKLRYYEQRRGIEKHLCENGKLLGRIIESIKGKRLLLEIM